MFGLMSMRLDIITYVLIYNTCVLIDFAYVLIYYDIRLDIMIYVLISRMRLDIFCVRLDMIIHVLIDFTYILI